mmetsp:Transcript_7590/g.10473  ORF Transcript_7590/g.10473 Transcript_7590/m.10473 type:complete len:201 (-) Transcript_7590:170-772(-)
MTKDQVRLISSQMFSNEDSHLIMDLTTQFTLFCANFTVGGIPTQEGSKLMNSLTYLKKLCKSKQTILQKEYEQNTVGMMVQEEKHYFLEGTPIQFKVLKNRPKNGDFQRRWNKNFQSLQKYKEIHGHLHVTRSTSGYQDLGNWVSDQRRKLKKGKLTLKQFELLTTLGLEWNTRSVHSHLSINPNKVKELPSYFLVNKSN